MDVMKAVLLGGWRGDSGVILWCGIGNMVLESGLVKGNCFLWAVG